MRRRSRVEWWETDYFFNFIFFIHTFFLIKRKKKWRLKRGSLVAIRSGSVVDWWCVAPGDAAALVRLWTLLIIHVWRKKKRIPRFIFYPPSLFLSVFILPVSLYHSGVSVSLWQPFLLYRFFSLFFFFSIKSMTAVHIAQMTKSELTVCFCFFPMWVLLCSVTAYIFKLLPLYSHAVFIAMIKKKSPPFKWFIKKMLYYK